MNTMSKDEMTANKEQQLGWIKQALLQDGFVELNFPAMTYKKEIKKEVYVMINLKEKLEPFFMVVGNRIDEDDEAGTLASVATLIVNAMDGQLPTKKDSDEVIGDVPPVGNAVPDTQKPAENINSAAESVKNADSVFSNVPTVHKSPIGYKPTLSVSVIKKYINDKVTDEEAYVFLELCKARNLNPFVGDVHLIKYDHTKPATMVVAKDAFMKRAESHSQYDGFEAGIIIENTTGNTEHRIGTFYKDNEILLGGWAKVYRKDYAHPADITVSFREFNTGKSSWNKMPAIMIRKVAIVNAMRESFPSELGGLYDASEMGVDIV